MSSETSRQLSVKDEEIINVSINKTIEIIKLSDTREVFESRVNGALLILATLSTKIDISNLGPIFEIIRRFQERINELRDERYYCILKNCLSCINDSDFITINEEFYKAYHSEKNLKLINKRKKKILEKANEEIDKIEESMKTLEKRIDQLKDITLRLK